jgi:hypothetical protein
VKDASGKKNGARRILKRRRADSISRGTIDNDRRRCNNMSKFELRGDSYNTDNTEEYDPTQDLASHSTVFSQSGTKSLTKFELSGDSNKTEATEGCAHDQESKSHSTRFWQSWTKSPPTPTTAQAQKAKAERFSEYEQEAGKEEDHVLKEDLYFVVPKKDSYLIENRQHMKLRPSKRPRWA